MGRGNWTADENARFIGPLFHNVPDAVLVPATHITRDADSKPIQRVWNPFLNQLIVFGKHLDDNHEHIHKIMQVGDVADRTEQFGFGFYWQGTFSALRLALQRNPEPHQAARIRSGTGFTAPTTSTCGSRSWAERCATRAARTSAP